MGPAYREDTSFAPGVAEERLPGLVRVLADNPGPFTYTGTGTYIIGMGAVAVLDPGPDLDSHFDALMAALDGKSVSHILVTHTHLDHSPLARRLADAVGAAIYAYGPHGSGRTGGLDGEDVEAGADKDFAPDHRLADGDLVPGDGWTLRAIHTPGHTSNHLCFYWQEEEILFTGDHVMGWSSTIVSPPDGDMRAYMASLDTLIASSPKKLVPTHGPIMDDAISFMTALKGHRLGREAQIVDCLKAGSATIPDMVKTLYADVDIWLHPAAERSVLSHIIALIEEGRVATDGAAKLDSTYRLAGT